MKDSAYKTAKLPIFSVDMSRDEFGIDTFIENGVVEQAVDPFSGNGLSYVRQRPAFEVANILTNTAGVYQHSYYPFYALGAVVYHQEDGGSATTVWTGTNATTTKGKFTLMRDTQNDRDQMLFVEGSTGKLVSIDKSTLTPTVQAAAPTPLNPHVATLDGYLFAAKENTDEIYNSNINDVSTWDTGTDFIKSLSEPGNITALQTYKNYVVAFKAKSMEFFYNAALSGTSPLQRNDSLRTQVGCEYPFTICLGEDMMFWVGRGVSGLSPSVYMMTGDKLTKVSNPAIDRQLQSSFVSYDKVANYRAFLLKESGHTYYVIRADQGATILYMAYNLENNQWGYWTFNAGSELGMVDVFDPPEENTDGPYFYWYNEAGNATYLGKFSIPNSQYDSYLGTNYPIIVLVETPQVDFGTVKRKVISLLRVIGTLHPTFNIRVRWSDDDTNWSNWHTIPINTNPVIRNLGQTRRRRFQIEFVNVATETPATRLTTLPANMRFEGLELEYREGVN